MPKYHGAKKAKLYVLVEGHDQEGPTGRNHKRFHPAGDAVLELVDERVQNGLGEPMFYVPLISCLAEHEPHAPKHVPLPFLELVAADDGVVGEMARHRSNSFQMGNGIVTVISFCQ